MRPGIVDIGACLPPDGLQVSDLAPRFRAEPEFVRTKLGFQRLRRKAADQSCSDLCVAAFEDLARRGRGPATPPEAVIVVTQNPDGGGIPHVAAVVHRKLALPPETSCFDVSLGCSGYVHALSIALGFLRENGLTRGLLFTADPYSEIIDPDDRDTALLFGDAATCTLLADRPAFHVGRTAYHTEGRFGDAIRVASRGGRLRMDGNQVFRFVTKAVPPLIRRCLDQNRLAENDIDVFLVHQGSRYIVDTLRGQLRLPPERMPFATEQTGNTISSTIPHLLQGYLGGGPRRVLLVGFGVGLAAAATVLFQGGERVPH